MRLVWQVDRTVRKMRSRIAKRLYRDHAGGPDQAILVAGMARTGTTWLAELLVSQLHARLMFEPFNPRYVDEYGAFEYVQYVAPDEEAIELHHFVADVLSGRLRDPGWVDRMVSVWRPEARVVKAVRACLMLGWIRVRFPDTSALLVVRHPCAVAASFAALGWSARPDLDSMRRQAKLREDHLQDVAGFLDGAWSPHEETAIAWCVNHRVALRQTAADEVIRVHYEDLVTDPDREIPRILRAMGRESDGLERSVLRALRRPSRTARLSAADRDESPAAEWRRALQPSQVAEIGAILQAFELDGLYDDEGRPTGLLHEPA